MYVFLRVALTASISLNLWRPVRKGGGVSESESVSVSVSVSESERESLRVRVRMGVRVGGTHLQL